MLDAVDAMRRTKFKRLRFPYIFFHGDVATIPPDEPFKKAIEDKE
jgi:hypothetical protein